MGGLDLRWQPMGAPYPRSPRLEGGAEPSFLPSSSSVWTALGRCAPPSMQGNTRRTGVMTDVHRRFLQLLMTHGVLEECDVKRLQKHCYKVHDCNATVEKLEDFINTINSVLESLYIEIKKGVTEDDGRPIYALVNLATTSVSKMASDFAENELDLFRKALELIIDSDTGFASSTNILNLVDQLKGKKMRKKEAEHVLQKFVQNKWLIEKEGEFTLHGRAILEMDQYIRETYPDAVKVCNICRSLLIQIPVVCLPLSTLYSFRPEQPDQCWWILCLSFCFRFFLMRTVFKASIEFVTALLLFFYGLVFRQ
uniref:Non-structural maintenance of chromosomes element 1 homolog n=1 Tax=Bos indicus x Bos taurus TaxID=30522 RepID=A0A4W2C8M8_BOBOX